MPIPGPGRERMFTLTEETEVPAPAERVWGLLVDFASYPDWNPYLLSLETSCEPGSRIVLRLVQPNWKRPITVRPLLTDYEPRSREIRWQTKVLSSLIFGADHVIRVETLVGGGCRIVQSERFSGLFCSLLPSSARRATRLSFRLMNIALKRRAEGVGWG